MAIYNLEEDLDVFIAPCYYGDNKFEYSMTRFDSKESKTTIRYIDLKTDKLMIYGTEIEISMLQRLHESLILKKQSGYIYVNCNGACHFWVNGKGLSPIQNVIFDWSPYGVIVPNSSLDSSKQKLEQKEDEIKEMHLKLSAVEAEVVSTKIESEKEIKELKEQLMTCEKNKHEMGLKLEKVCTHLSLIDFELEVYKVELKSSKNEVNELQHRLSIYMEEIEYMEAKLGNVQDQLITSNLELVLSRKKVVELEEELSISRNESQGMKTELHNFEVQMFSANSELDETKKQLQSSNIRTIDLGAQLDSLRMIVRNLEEDKMHTQGTKAELQRVQEQLIMSNLELELSRRKVLELKEELSISKNQSQGMKTELHTFEKKIFSANLELEDTKKQLRSSNVRIIDLGTQLDSLIKIVRELDEHKMDTEGTKAELQSVQGRLSATDCELQMTKVKLESYQKHTRGLKDHISSIDSKLKYTNEKLEQLLVSMLWSKLEHEHRHLLAEEFEVSPSKIAVILEHPCLVNNLQVEEDNSEGLSNHIDLGSTQDK